MTDGPTTTFADGRKPINAVPTVVFIDHSYLDRIQWVQKFAAHCSDVKIVLITDKSPSGLVGNLETINVRDRISPEPMAELQKTLNFSIYRALVAERAYFDYTTFDNSQCYSDVKIEDVEKLISSYVTVLDEVIATRADLVIGHLADNAIASLAMNLAINHKKPYAAAFPYYWWSNGLFFVDRGDQTSSDVDLLYRYYYENPDRVDASIVSSFFSRPRVSHAYSDAVTYSLKQRIQKIVASQEWYEPFSARNWLWRRLSYLISELRVKISIPRVTVLPTDQRYVIFPLHVAPEASLLGSTPELADQFSLIKDISINLPWGVMLYVKLHPAQKRWSGPNYYFFSKLTALKNVKIVEASVPASSFYEDANCLAVATINGTVGLEAAVEKKAVFVFGKAIYGVADCFIKPANFAEFRDAIFGIDRGTFSFNHNAFSAVLMALNAAVWTGQENFASELTTEAAVMKTFVIYEEYINSGIWRAEGPTRLAALLDRLDS